MISPPALCSITRTPPANAAAERASLSEPERPSPDAPPPFRLIGALDGQSPFLLTSPHCGTYLPPEFLGSCQLPLGTIRRLEDTLVGDIIAPSAQALGIPLMMATHSRAALDLNRSANELDPTMFRGKVDPKPFISHRVHQGYGLFPRIAASGHLIHNSRWPAAYGQRLINDIHLPWHDHVEQSLDLARRQNGYAVLLDCHSMPPLRGPDAPDVVLGDRHGDTAHPALMDWLEDAFTREGLRVDRNNPYAGGFMVAHHARPTHHVHAIQIEVDRSLYLDMDSLQPHAGMADMKALYQRIFTRLSAEVSHILPVQRHQYAAE